MKFYDCATAPSPRRVRIFLAEKGIEVPTVQVDLRTGEHFGEAFRKINPMLTVPALELDDGTCVSEVEAVCRYFEEAYPDPPLMGVDAADKAVVAMWEHRCEFDGVFAVAEHFRNSVPGLKGRALPGPLDLEQIPELAERGKRRVEQFFRVLDGQLAENEFVAGSHYTVADITALVTVDFAGRLKLTLPEELGNARRWHDAVSARPSAKA